MSTNDSNSSGRPSVDVALPGGVTRVDFGNPDHGTDEGTSNDPLRGGVANGAAYRTDAAGNVEEFGKFTRHNVYADIPRHADDVISTARTAWGTPAREIGPDTVVDINGMSLRVKDAVSCGWMRKLGNGEFVPTGRHLSDREGLGMAPAGDATHRLAIK